MAVTIVRVRNDSTRVMTSLDPAEPSGDTQAVGSIVKQEQHQTPG